MTISPTTDAVVQLGRLALDFGRVDRRTFHQVAAVATAWIDAIDQRNEERRHAAR